VSQPLKGRRIALAEARELDLLAGMFQRAGADAVRCPLVAILDAPDSAPIEAWIRRAIAGELDVVVLYTGEGLRRILGVAERAGLREEFVAALGQVRKLTRGPKPVRALREIGLSPDLIAEEPTTHGIIATLESEALDGRKIGVQIYGEEPNLQLVAFLQMRGAKIDLVAPYVYASAAEGERVDGLIHEMANGRIDAIAFTSSPQVQRLAKAAEDAGLSEILTEGFRRTKVVAIGPVVGEELSRLGISPDAVADAPYAMKPLLGAIERLFSKTR
jgi:uroporphyrinogen-III synthase